MPDPATGGTLHDAIFNAAYYGPDCPYTAWDTAQQQTDAVLVALKEHLAEHPEAIEELGWEDVARRDGWLIDVGSGHMRENLVPVKTVYGARVYAPPPNVRTLPAPPTPSIPGEDA